MLDKIFLQILNMSFTASIVILFVVVVRLLLKNAPKNFSYALWSVVMFRLICPFSFESIFGLLPTKVTPISQDIVYMTVPKIDTGILAINNVVNTSLSAATPSASMNPLMIWVFFGRTAWLVGIAILSIYSIVSLLRLHKQLKNAVHERDNIYILKGFQTPFVIGLSRPRIYLPATLSKEEKSYILLHEQTHIKRFDHVVKILSFFVLCLHWFNPLVWLAFFLSNKDMEMSCDEAVIKKMGNDVKKDYSSSLLSLATGRRFIGGTPLAFGEGDTKDRIKNVLNYKKPAFWIVIIALVLVIAVGFGLLANPMDRGNLPDVIDEFNQPSLEDITYGKMIAGNDSQHIMNFSKAKADEIAKYLKTLKISNKEISKSRVSGRDMTNQIVFYYKNPNVIHHNTLIKILAWFG